VTPKLYAFTCGWLTAPLDRFLEGETGTITAPVEVFLIDHPKGKAVFDTGLPKLAQTDPAAAYGRVNAETFKPTFKAGEDVAGRLEALGIDASKIDFIINSHLHFDHCGGNSLLPNATVVVQSREWLAGLDPTLGRQVGLNPKHFDLGHKVKQVDGEHDLFGDGSVIVFPTYGHTPGHQSVRLKSGNGGSGDIILTGDCCYLHRTLENLHLPPFSFDKKAQRTVLLKLRELRANGCRIIYGHDPDLWRTLPQAPARLI
jgi:glyoxylase-like metal-dependent hydrolase (beta-lactamase superfamily II)